MMANSLDLSIKKIKGIGQRTAESLAGYGLNTIRDLVEYYPYRYEDYSQSKTISTLKPDETVSLRAKVNSIQSRKSFKNRRMTITEAVISDSTGSLAVTWFNQPYITNTLQAGREYIFYGKTSWRGKLQFNSPTFEPADPSQDSQTGKIVPVYSLPDGVFPKRYRQVIWQIINSLDSSADILPEAIRQRNKLLPLAEAWRQIHFPESLDLMNTARRRLAFEELFIMQLKILQRRELLKTSNAIAVPFNQAKVKAFVDALPFKLTGGQRKSAWEIIQDLEKTTPMNRLLQGDVGSGKTVVAAIAAASTAWAGGQTAFLAPTEILAQQHFATLDKLLTPQGFKVAMLTGSSKEKDRQAIYDEARQGKIDCLVGTHALLNEKLTFKKLALLVVDEQQRFGVKQRSTLRFSGNGSVPHLLSMTATPIPRTVALTLYGDLAVSTIPELPPGRQKITTLLIGHKEREKAYALITREILSGRQVFVICPLIEESDAFEARSVIEEHQRLSKEVFPQFSVGMIHGRMSAAEKDEIMGDFKNSKYHILVSTSVIEVGIDVPNATVILIEGAERFGLAQLHQFRGRVGRGEHQSYCLLLPSGIDTPARLQALTQYDDGFQLAELDLKFRGMGQLVGVKQSGFLETKIADPTDLEMVKLARAEAEAVVSAGMSKFPALQQLVREDEIAATRD